MEVKDKAKELVNKFKEDGLWHQQSKRCAIICVDETIKAMKQTSCRIEYRDYWYEVKTEIQKL